MRKSSVPRDHLGVVPEEDGSGNQDSSDDGLALVPIRPHARQHSMTRVESNHDTDGQGVRSLYTVPPKSRSDEDTNTLTSGNYQNRFETTHNYSDLSDHTHTNTVDKDSQPEKKKKRLAIIEENDRDNGEHELFPQN